MLTVDDYARITQAHRDGMSLRQIAETFRQVFREWGAGQRVSGQVKRQKQIDSHRDQLRPNRALTDLANPCLAVNPCVLNQFIIEGLHSEIKLLKQVHLQSPTADQHDADSGHPHFICRNRIPISN
jgi:hypothetical protein